MTMVVFSMFRHRLIRRVSLPLLLVGISSTLQGCLDIICHENAWPIGPCVTWLDKDEKDETPAVAAETAAPTAAPVETPAPTAPFILDETPPPPNGACTVGKAISQMFQLVFEGTREDSSSTINKVTLDDWDLLGISVCAFKAKDHRGACTPLAQGDGFSGYESFRLDFNVCASNSASPGWVLTNYRESLFINLSPDCTQPQQAYMPSITGYTPQGYLMPVKCPASSALAQFLSPAK
eukprot:TRINITY_DN14351_c1_g5_i1.p1 TRINITY_DN14351_c1_g5~~TRINITY_DN14351_c1_g5_i1.p1  ORF type:complete len:237 (-),score=27.16 TRINITY_DN14351_c1_g5_i1:528-1238(-)